VVLFLAVMFGGATLLWWSNKRATAEGEAWAAVREADPLLEAEKWSEALSAAKRAEGVIGGFWAEPVLRHRVEQLIKDSQMGLRLEGARLMGSELKQYRPQDTPLTASGFDHYERFDSEAIV
jgi:hypothetical protein